MALAQEPEPLIPVAPRPVLPARLRISPVVPRCDFQGSAGFSPAKVGGSDFSPEAEPLADFQAVARIEAHVDNIVFDFEPVMPDVVPAPIGGHVHVFPDHRQRFFPCAGVIFAVVFVWSVGSIAVDVYRSEIRGGISCGGSVCETYSFLC